MPRKGHIQPRGKARFGEAAQGTASRHRKVSRFPLRPARFRDTTGQRFWRADRPDGETPAAGYGPLEGVACNEVNCKRIATHWPDMPRAVGSLITNQVRACDLLRKFGREGLAAASCPVPSRERAAVRFHPVASTGPAWVSAVCSRPSLAPPFGTPAVCRCLI